MLKMSVIYIIIHWAVAFDTERGKRGGRRSPLVLGASFISNFLAFYDHDGD